MKVDLLRRHSSLVVLLATIVLLELAHGVEIVTLLPLYLTGHFGKDEIFVGVVASTYLFVDTLVTRTPAGLIADRWGYKPTLVLGILLSILPLPLMMSAGDANLFIPLNLVNGIGAGMVWPAMYALVANLYGRDQRGTVLGLVNMVMLGGLAVGGPITGSLMLNLFDYPDPRAFGFGFAACIFFVLLALALVLTFVRDAPTRTEGGLESSDALFDTLRAKGARSALSLLLLIGLAITLALGLIVPVLTLYGTRVLQLSLGTFALIMIPPALTAAGGLIPAGLWADKRGRQGPLLVGLILISIPFWGASFSTNPIVVSAGGMIAAAGYALLVPAWNALIMDWIPPERRGFFLGTVATVQGLGLAAGPVVGGILFQINVYAPFWMAGAILALGAILASILIRREGGMLGRVSLDEESRMSGLLG